MQSAYGTRWSRSPQESGSNEEHSRCHGKENQDLWQVKEEVERQHQRQKKDIRERGKEEMEHGGGCPGEGRAPEVILAVTEQNVGRLLADP